MRVTFPGVVFSQTEMLVGVTWPTSGPAIRVRCAGVSWNGRLEPKSEPALLAELGELAKTKERRVTVNKTYRRLMVRSLPENMLGLCVSEMVIPDRGVFSAVHRAETG